MSFVARCAELQNKEYEENSALMYKMQGAYEDYVEENTYEITLTFEEWIDHIINTKL